MYSAWYRGYAWAECDTTYHRTYNRLAHKQSTYWSVFYVVDFTKTWSSQICISSIKCLRICLTLVKRELHRIVYHRFFKIDFVPTLCNLEVEKYTFPHFQRGINSVMHWMKYKINHPKCKCNKLAHRTVRKNTSLFKINLVPDHYENIVQKLNL